MTDWTKSWRELSLALSNKCSGRFARRGHMLLKLCAVELVLLLYPGNNDGCRASQKIQAKAQSAENGRCPFQGLQRRIGSSGTLPSGEPGISRPRCCASWQGRRPFQARRALRSTASQLAASVIITWIEYQLSSSASKALVISTARSPRKLKNITLSSSLAMSSLPCSAFKSPNCDPFSQYCGVFYSDPPGT